MRRERERVVEDLGLGRSNPQALNNSLSLSPSQVVEQNIRRIAAVLRAPRICEIALNVLIWLVPEGVYAHINYVYELVYDNYVYTVYVLVCINNVYTYKLVLNRLWGRTSEVNCGRTSRGEGVSSLRESILPHVTRSPSTSTRSCLSLSRPLCLSCYRSLALSLSFLLSLSLSRMGGRPGMCRW